MIRARPLTDRCIERFCIAALVASLLACLFIP